MYVLFRNIKDLFKGVSYKMLNSRKIKRKFFYFFCGFALYIRTHKFNKYALVNLYVDIVVKYMF